MLNEFLKRGEMNIVQPLYIQACLPRLELAEIFQELGVLLRAGHHIEREVLFAWRETDQTHVTFVPACVFVMAASKADDTTSPHPGFRLRNLLHEFDDGNAVLTPLLVGDALHESCYAGFGLFRFEFGHFDLPWE